MTKPKPNLSLSLDINNIEDKDYEVVKVRNDKHNSIRLMVGEYEGVIFTIGRVALPSNKRPEDEEQVPMQFNYQIEDSGNFTKEELTEDRNFVNLMGDIIRDIITESYNAGKHTNDNTEDAGSE